MIDIVTEPLIVFVLGSPRSGTTFITDYIGKYADMVYNEPWESHPIESPHLWQFPKVKTIVFKYCENWRNLHVLMQRWPNSIYVHVWRDPDNVVYSMAYPKKDSYPQRDLYPPDSYGDFQKNERIKLCMERWFSNAFHCLSLINILPDQYCEIRYGNIKPGLQKLASMSGLEFNLNEIKYESKNQDPRLDWSLNPKAASLRDVIRQYKGEVLAEWVNHKMPKFLQRSIL